MDYYYALWDSTAYYTFPVPIVDWTDQLLGEGLNGVPAINAYRLHTWTWPFLDEDDIARLAAYYRRQQLGTPLDGIETDPYNPEEDPTTLIREYTDVRIKSLSRERGPGPYTSVTISFEILVT